MSTQEIKLQAIADAIRTKDGTTAPIAANDFAARILAIQAGGGFAVPLVVTADVGTVITAVNGDTTVTGTVGSSGSVTMTLPSPGDWSVTAQLGDITKGPEIVSVQDGYTSRFSMVSRLPEGYTEIEYIESSEGAGINTQIIPTDTFKLMLDVEPIEIAQTAQYIAYSGVYMPLQQSGYWGGIFWTQSGVKTSSGGGSTITNTFRTISPDTTPRKMSITLDYPNKTAAIEGEAEISVPSPSYATNMSSLALLSNGSTATAVRARLYSCKIELNDEIVRDFVPCVNPTGEIGLYDLSGSQFYGNAHSGAFTAGPAV